MADVREQAFAMFGNGESVNAVAKKLFKGYYAKAKQLRAEYDGSGAQGGGG